MSHVLIALLMITEILNWFTFNHKAIINIIVMNSSNKYDKLCQFLIQIFLALIVGKLGFAQTSTSLLPQDYKCGISIRYSGTEGVDWIAEDMYHDPLVNNRRTVYIKAATTITLFHNELNVLAKGPGSTVVLVSTGKDGNLETTADNGNYNMPGIIRYRVDGDMNIGKELWAWPPPKPAINGRDLPRQDILRLPKYTAPLSFATLMYEPYEPNLPVLNKVGSNGQAITDQLAYYHYGVRDSAGDEWHSLQIGDDDYDSYPTDREIYWASDGKEQLFVVNPKTPCITVTRTGNSQFYTTPAKVYFIPKIYDQTTYIQPGTGSVSIKLTNINGGTVEYRINGGAWINNSTAMVTLTDSAFDAGSNTLQCRYASTPDVVRTRKIVKNPPFPSAGERHGNLLWKDVDEFQKSKARLTRVPYKWYWESKLLGDPDTTLWKKWDAFGGKGYGRWAFGSYYNTSTAADTNAFVALNKGWDAKPSGSTKSWAQYAKGMLLENVLNLDPVGIQISTGNMPAPMTENRAAGYYVVKNTYSTAIAYDLLIAYYRSDQHANGITPIEDYFIRDMLASYALIVFRNFDGSNLGLWSIAQASGVLMTGLAMPDYDTPYYGTSGYNGTTSATHKYTPFPDDSFTWKEVLTDRKLAPGQDPSNPSSRVARYPNRSATYDIEDPHHTLFCTNSHWIYTNLGYWSTMTVQFWVITNLTAMHFPTSYQWPVIHKAYLYSVTGKMNTNCGNGPIQYYSQHPGVINDRHPTVAAEGRASLLVPPPEFYEEYTRDGKIPPTTNPASIVSLYSLCWFDDGEPYIPLIAPGNLR